MQKRVYTVNKKGKEVMIVDYSGCREEEMIQIVLVLKDRLIAENKHRLLLSIYGEGTRITTKFMDYVREGTPSVLPLLDKQAIVGLNLVKRMILKGYNFLFKRNIRDFDTVEEAIDFLVSDETTDRDIPDYMN